MNLSEALDAALPDIPKARFSRNRPPRIDPNLIVREQMVDGEPIIGLMQRGVGNFFRLHPTQWELAQLFDGVRSFEEIATTFQEKTGGALSAQEVENFAANLDESNFWYKSPQEKNLAMNARLMAQRERRANRKSKFNIAHISFSGWDPDRYLTWLDGKIGRMVYSRWTVLAVVLLFCFEGVVFVAQWKNFGPDIPLYYNFSHKTFLDFVEFWLLLFGLGFIHESAHGLTCKHYGGEVHNMGLMFLYLTPAFFVDVTEIWISATKVQRLATIIAGIWIEMVLCGIAMIVWLNTLPGQFLHDFTYKIILITGVAVVVMNLNPLLKLDGYYFLTELIGLPDLKEHSTAFATSWIQRWVLRLPVEVMVVPRRRILLFAVYATLSGAYSYAMLFFALRFVYNMTSKLLAEFALFPVSWLAVVMFRSRLKSLAGLLRKMWASNFATGFRPSPLAIAIAVALLLLIFVPIFREREDAYFLVEPSHPVTLHANVTGTIDAVYVREGETVHAGDPLLRMTSGYAASLNSNAQAARGAAHYAVFAAQMAGHSVGSAAADDEAARRAMLLAGEAQASLTIRATEDGRILTRDPDSLLYRRVAAGQPLIEFAGDEKNGQTSAAHPGEYVRLFVPAKALPHIQPGDEVALAPPGLFSIVRLRLTPLDGEAVPLPAGMIVHQDYRGIELPSFYCARLSLPDKSPGFVLGTAGVARIFGPRRSLAHSFLMVILNLIHAHVW